MSLNSKLAKHLALAATAVVATAAGTADASVITTNYNIVIGATTDGLYMNVETGANNGGSVGGGSTVAGWDINPWGSSSLNFFSNSTDMANGYFRVAGGATATSNLGVGQLIDAGNGTWQSSAAINTGVGAYVLNARNYFGFRFKNGAGSTLYGYMAIDIGASITTRTLAYVSYEDSGAGITVVPAPGAAALLGLAGLVGRRRRA